MLKIKHLFTKIINHEVPAVIIYQDELVTAFRDINPQAPTHVLIIPNIFIPTLNDIKKEDEPMIGHLISVAVNIAKSENIATTGYRLIINCNQHGGQEIQYIHLHLLGGCQLGPIIVN
ncbi:MAG: HIT domain-containing protein [Candidatus Dasytiphilus stammeri]